MNLKILTQNLKWFCRSVESGNHIFIQEAVLKAQEFFHHLDTELAKPDFEYFLYKHNLQFSSIKNLTKAYRLLDKLVQHQIPGALKQLEYFLADTEIGKQLVKRLEDTHRYLDVSREAGVPLEQNHLRKVSPQTKILIKHIMGRSVFICDYLSTAHLDHFTRIAKLLEKGILYGEPGCEEALDCLEKDETYRKLFFAAIRKHAKKNGAESTLWELKFDRNSCYFPYEEIVEELEEKSKVEKTSSSTQPTTSHKDYMPMAMRFVNQGALDLLEMKTTDDFIGIINCLHDFSSSNQYSPSITIVATKLYSNFFESSLLKNYNCVASFYQALMQEKGTSAEKFIRLIEKTGSIELVREIWKMMQKNLAQNELLTINQAFLTLYQNKKSASSPNISKYKRLLNTCCLNRNKNTLGKKPTSRTPFLPPIVEEKSTIAEEKTSNSAVLLQKQ
jgi:hypothetical protein